MSRNNQGWGSVVGDELPEKEEAPAFDDQTDPDAQVAKPLFDLQEQKRGPALSLPKPGDAAKPAGTLSLPKPAGYDPNKAAPAIKPPPVTGFSADQMAKLATAGIDTSMHKPPMSLKTPMMILGAGLVIAVAAWLTFGSNSPAEAPAEPTENAPTIADGAPTEVQPPPGQPVQPVQPPPGQPVQPPVEKAPPPQAKAKAKNAEQPVKPAAYPMLSVMSSPAGAIVEINGLARGKTPLVMRSPTPKRQLRLKLMKSGYKNWEGMVSANETGHFVIKQVLERR